MTDGLEVVGHLEELVIVEVDLITELTQRIGEGLGGGLAGTAGEGGDSGVDDIAAGFDSLEGGHERQTGGAVGVQDNRKIHGVLDGGDQVVCGFRGADTGHVLDADGGYAHLLELFDHLDILLESVDRARGIGDGTGGNGTGLDGLIDGDLEVVDVVQRVKDTDNVDAVANSSAYEAANNVITVVLVAENVLPAKEHLELGVGHLCPDLPKPFPGIFIQEAKADVKGRAAPAFRRIETRLIDRRENILELIVGHTRRDQGLTSVTQYGFGKLNFLHPFSSCRF